MSQASDYPVTFPFGATDPPYSASRPHQGDDHAMPTGTQVMVNGTLIGLSGATGAGVTGPHLHIGHYVNGAAVNPEGGGFELPAPVTVFDASTTTNDGNYVRLKVADGSIWLYDHLSDNSIVKAGQTLEGAEMAEKVSLNAWRIAAFSVLGRNGLFGTTDALAGGSDADWQNRWKDVDLNEQFYATLYESEEAKNWRARLANLEKGDSAAATQLNPGLYRVG